jgi:toxin ParE1/3/4
MLDSELLPPARDEYDESYAWYCQRSERAAEGFEQSIESAIGKLCADPTPGIRIDDEHRFYRLKKSYPFYLVYRVESMKLIVVAVAHHRRRPNFWHSR